MISGTKRLEVLLDGVSKGYIHLRLNGDLKVTKVSKELAKINPTCLMAVGGSYGGFDFKSYETTLRKGLKRRYGRKIRIKESPLPAQAEKLYRKSLRLTGRL